VLSEKEQPIDRQESKSPPPADESPDENATERTLSPGDSLQEMHHVPGTSPSSARGVGRYSDSDPRLFPNAFERSTRGVTHSEHSERSTTMAPEVSGAYVLMEVRRN
jgi:hypothetical protein